MTALRVVGLDLSLTSTGLSDGQSVRVAQTSEADSIEHRFDHLTDECLSYVRRQVPGVSTRYGRADLVVIEGSAFGAKGNAVEQLAGLRFIIRTELWRLDIPFVIVPPSTLKAYTTGNGRATKAQMVAALEQRHGLILRSYKVKDGKYDMADAYALAAMGYAALGQPLGTVGPPPPRKSLLAVSWPCIQPDVVC